MTRGPLCLSVFAVILFTHAVDLCAQNTVVSWAALDMGLSTSTSATGQVLAVAGQVLTGSLKSAHTMIAGGLLANTSLHGGVTTGAKAQVRSSHPTEYRLEQNYPNPFNPGTVIRYGLPSRANVRISVFNTLGQKVAEMVNGDYDAGYHEVLFEASALASGMYLYRMQVRPLDSAQGRDSKGGTGDFVQARRLILLR